MSKINLWTVVQHSGYGYGGDATFMRGLETRTVDNVKDRNTVTKAGGLLFDSYSHAEDWVEAEMYRGQPTDLEHMVPQALGTFADKSVDGLAIYVPFDPDATYAAFFDGQQFGILPGRLAVDCLSRSTDPTKLRFTRM